MYVKQIQLAWLCTLLALQCHNYCEKLCDIVVSIVIITSINHHHHCCEKLCDNMVSIVVISSITHINILIMTLSLTLQYHYRCCSCKQSLFYRCHCYHHHHCHHQHRAVITGWGPGIFSGYYEGDPCLLSSENRRKYNTIQQFIDTPLVTVGLFSDNATKKKKKTN